jgi:hypothetical protein
MVFEPPPAAVNPVTAWGWLGHLGHLEVIWPPPQMFRNGSANPEFLFFILFCFIIIFELG